LRENGPMDMKLELVAVPVTEGNSWACQQMVAQE
jgi:hypothetical protein